MTYDLKIFNYRIIGTCASLILICCLLCLFADSHKHYRSGYNDGKLAEKKASATPNHSQATDSSQWSGQNDEKQNAENEVKMRGTEKQIIKIVKVPVYNYVCLNASGVWLINEAIGGRQHLSQP